MGYNIYFFIEGPQGTLDDIPNNTNPVECESLRTLLEKLSESLPHHLTARLSG